MDDSLISDSASTDKQENDPVVLLGQMYADYLHVDCNQQVQTFDDSIEELLTRLDEYHGLLDMIRSDTSLCLQKTLPLVRQKSSQLQQTFEKIDKLEMFVAMVKQNMMALEAQVEKAESEMGSFSAIKKVINSFSLPSFLTSKKKSSPATSPTKAPPTFTSPPIFATEDYMVHECGDGDKVSHLGPSLASANIYGIPESIHTHHQDSIANGIQVEQSISSEMPGIEQDHRDGHFEKRQNQKDKSENSERSENQSGVKDKSPDSENQSELKDKSPDSENQLKVKDKSPDSAGDQSDSGIPSSIASESGDSLKETVENR